MSIGALGRLWRLTVFMEGLQPEQESKSSFNYRDVALLPPLSSHLKNRILNKVMRNSSPRVQWISSIESIFEALHVKLVLQLRS